ncbi:ATP-dependent DNA ligase [Chromatium weissei]|nr:ATP-dependent DNA ligase [Chromatium weissei]
MIRAVFLFVITLALTTTAAAHFQELIPSTEIVDDAGDNPIELQLQFTHPMERGPVMTMAQPVQFGVISPDGRENLLPSLTANLIADHQTFHASYRIKQPGDYLFFVEPAPYWEPAEGLMIIHYTKVIVSAFGAETGWDTEIGLPVEIIPLTRPYGLWTGNLFTGIVKRNGQPVSGAKVEIEWRNDGSVTPPASPFVTQIVKTDVNGVFNYAMPRAGWWGFAALLNGDTPLKNSAGEMKPVETGAVLWVHTRNMK